MPPAGGNDTAVYSGSHLDYHVDQLANGDLWIIDLRPGSPDGTDTIHAIEHVSFSDSTVTRASPVMPAAVHWSAGVDIVIHPAGYQPVAVADFSGDGTSDLLWFNPGSRDVDLWEISNGHWSGSVDIVAHPPVYQPMSAGDFNHVAPAMCSGSMPQRAILRCGSSRTGTGLRAWTSASISS